MDAPAKKSKLIKGAKGDWEVVIGMEVHAQVTAQAKLFSAASTAFGGGPNEHVSLVDAAMPGMLPVINEECVRQAVRTGLGLKAKINLKSVFDRKNYFYPDLPQGYQISQYKSPIVSGGEVVIDVEGGGTKKVGIERIHLEQDAGKLLHEQLTGVSLIDLNRSGVALMEIVSKPEMNSFDEAMNFIAKLRIILRYLGTCDGDMEKGHLRADVNVSMHRRGEPLGTRCEIKNLNSITFIGDAIECEQRRQREILEEGGKIEQETRLYDPDKGETRSMRSKEEAHDYRYFPDPDLLPLELTQEEIDKLRADLPELPDEKRARFVQDYVLPVHEAARLVGEKERADYYEKMIQTGADPKATANWLINEYLGRLNRLERKVDDVLPISARLDRPIGAVQVEGEASLGPVPASSNSTLVIMVSSGVISGNTAKDILDHMIEHPDIDPREYVEKNNLHQVTDVSAIAAIVDDIVAKNPDKIADAKKNPKAIGWFIGQVMKASGGKANPQAVNDLLKKKLGT
jgi:aspartyl-tRNA(Asn)/glutamyl-tRNA(Gln) amidotransferase subunit B